MAGATERSLSSTSASTARRRRAGAVLDSSRATFATASFARGPSPAPATDPAAPVGGIAELASGCGSQNHLAVFEQVHELVHCLRSPALAELFSGSHPLGQGALGERLKIAVPHAFGLGGNGARHGAGHVRCA